MSNWKVKVETDVWKLSDGSFYEGEYLGEDKRAVKVCKAGFKYQVSYLEKIGYLKFKKRLDKNFLNSAEISNYGYKKKSNAEDITDYSGFFPRLIGLILLLLIGMCISTVGGNSPSREPYDPREFLTPDERRETCYELYEDSTQRASLLACLAKTYSDN